VIFFIFCAEKSAEKSAAASFAVRGQRQRQQARPWPPIQARDVERRVYRAAPISFLHPVTLSRESRLVSFNCRAF